MKITFDAAKREATLDERGFDFAGAEAVFAGPTYSAEDTRKSTANRVSSPSACSMGAWWWSDGLHAVRIATSSASGKPMTASEPDTSTDWSKADAYQNTPADYEELPELDDAFFGRAQSGKAIDIRSIPLMTNPEETGRIARLRDAIVEIWGRPAYDVKGVGSGPDGELLLMLKPARAEKEKTRIDDN